MLGPGAVLFLSAGAAVAGPTNTFIDRDQPTDIRVVSYNIFFDSIFPDVDSTQAAKFVRVVNALDPDILNLQEINRSAADVVTLMNSIAPLPGMASWHAHQGRDNVIVSRYALSLTAQATVPAGERDLAMALVDLPDGQYDVDFYFMNNHYKCCGGLANEADRQRQSDALVNWMRDARTPGGFIDLPPGTPMAVVGDLNIVEPPGMFDPLGTVLTGDIWFDTIYGLDSPPDWDGTSLADAHPLHNVTGPADYTWRRDSSPFAPGRLDYIIYTDSALEPANNFVLNTVDMTPADRLAAGLQEFDIVLDEIPSRFDHLPVVTDFRVIPEPATLTVLVVVGLSLLRRCRSA